MDFDNFYKDIRIFKQCLPKVQDDSLIDFIVKFLTNKYEYDSSWRPIEVYFRITEWHNRIIE